tara:strand:+ start:44977 stop:45552 length:576 start_codon:yes stop_codon:yes gene_type:complete
MDKEEVLSIIKSKASKFSTKQKIWLAAIFFLWLAQSLLWFAYPPDEGFLFNRYFIDPNTSEVFVLILVIAGLVYSIYRKIKFRKENKDKSLLYIISSDYTLSSYASLRILSIVYAIIQGVLLGASSAFIIQVFGSILSFSKEPLIANSIYLFVSIFYLLITRILIEFVSLTFRVAEDLSKLANKTISKIDD